MWGKSVQSVMTNTKRIFDVILSLFLGIVTSPLMLAIVVGIKITSPGPVLFRQQRLGLQGRVFLMNKFRKFPADWGNKGPSVTLQYDSRMTSIGQFLERTKLDELPQLWNIFIGEMSFVGPRPESLSFAHMFDGKYREVLDYKPGIFGPNQTAYRNESAMYPDGEDPVTFYERELFPAKAQNDIDYFGRSSFLGDLKWIGSGVFVLLFSAIVWRKSMRSSLVLLVWDVAAVLIAWMVMYWMKYSVIRPDAVSVAVADLFKLGLLVLPLVLICVFAVARVYRHPIRYFSSTDAYRLAGNCFAVWMLSAVVFRVAYSTPSVMLLGASCVLSIFIMACPRVAYQQWFSRFGGQGRTKQLEGKVNVAVCGVDNQSIGLCNFLTEGFDRVNLVGIIADDKSHVRREVHGIPVIGMWSDLDVLQARFGVQQIWMGTNTSKAVKSGIVEWCASKDVSLIVLEDLLGFSDLAREPRPDQSVDRLKSREPKKELTAKPRESATEAEATA